MIRQEQAEPAMPRALLVIVLQSREHDIADVGAAQFILTHGYTINRDENQLPSATHCGLCATAFCKQATP